MADGSCAILTVPLFHAPLIMMSFSVSDLPQMDTEKGINDFCERMAVLLGDNIRQIRENPDLPNPFGNRVTPSDNLN